ncbi:PDZ domain containing protein, partial [Euroglyphus maynei]
MAKKSNNKNLTLPTSYSTTSISAPNNNNETNNQDIYINYDGNYIRTPKIRSKSIGNMTSSISVPNGLGPNNNSTNKKVQIITNNNNKNNDNVNGNNITTMNIGYPDNSSPSSCKLRYISLNNVAVQYSQQPIPSTTITTTTRQHQDRLYNPYVAFKQIQQQPSSTQVNHNRSIFDNGGGGSMVSPLSQALCTLPRTNKPKQLNLINMMMAEHKKSNGVGNSCNNNNVDLVDGDQQQQQQQNSSTSKDPYISYAE